MITLLMNITLSTAVPWYITGLKLWRLPGASSSFKPVHTLLAVHPLSFEFVAWSSPGIYLASMLTQYAILVVLPLLSLIHPSWAGNTTCASGQLDWYTSVVGETPCMTYQRLRQICDNYYQVPNFQSYTPGDNCDSQVSACCCNTVAFQLSMLCMNCQEDRLAGAQDGIDASAGAYTLYRATCGAGTNNSLPSDIQAAVCDEGIRLDDFLYGGWADGSWRVVLYIVAFTAKHAITIFLARFYVWSRENAERNHAANNNNTFTHCPNQISPSPTTTIPIITSTNTPKPFHATTTTTEIVGGAMGATVLVLLVVGGLLFRQCRKSRTHSPPDGTRNPYLDHGHSPLGCNPFDNQMTMEIHGTYVAIGRDGLQQNLAPLRHGSADEPGIIPSSSASAVIPTPESASNEISMRHTDAGATGPLFRSSSGSLPPSYYSREHGPPEYQYHACVPESMSVLNTAHIGAVETPRPLVLVRRGDEKTRMLS
ncbi:hypothetical protein C8Q70DRAFT_435731 [Cubamyces menziesii]|nr:hypothetical protein C8Q70DRAFT_435731 [Cubamyces menziesii]